jgi:hypothetical protein
LAAAPDAALILKFPSGISALGSRNERKRTECTEGAAMGTCSIEVGRELKEKLLRAPYPRDVIILRKTVFDDDSYLLWVSSPLLGSGDNGAQELEVDGDAIRFKPRRR